MSVESATIIGGASRVHKRNDADFYPTPPECTLALLAKFGSVFSGDVWEPACGDGAISRVLEGQGLHVESTDLRHSGYGRGGVDFLKAVVAPAGVSAIITNPPFNLAEAFIRKAREFEVPFAMLLKSTYWHAASRERLFKSTGPVAVCPMLWRPNFAPERGSAPTMDVCWTVWHAHPVKTCAYTPLPKPVLSAIKGDIFQ